MRHPSILLVAAAFAAPLVSGFAHADTPVEPHATKGRVSRYERESVAQVMRKHGGTVDPAPEGKIIEGIDVATLDVFERRDPLPGFLIPIANWFHFTSRRDVIEREVLLAPGDRYDQTLIDESARNLRALSQVSLVLVIPLKGSAEDRVRLLVLTKDTWSLRLNGDYLFANGRLQQLTVEPSEENLGGTHQALSAKFVMDPATLSFGGTYRMPRIGGSRIGATATANVILNRATGALEGSLGSFRYGESTTSVFTYGQPLYSTRAKWAWVASLDWDNEYRRRFVGGLVTDFNAATGTCRVPTTPTGGSDPLRCEYHRDSVFGGYGLTRSFGTNLKHNITVGVAASRRVYRTDDLSSLSASDRAAFLSAVVPVSDTRIAPFIEYHDFSSRYLNALDLDTLGLTENVQRGHDITVRLTPASTALLSSRSYLDVYAAATYTLPLGTGLVRGSVVSDTEIATDGLPNASIDVSARVVTPHFGFGRLVFGAHLLDRYRNLLNVRDSLGGDTRLRGYPTQAFVGKDVVSANLEFRSKPVEVYAVQLAGVLFADTGDAFDSFDRMVLKQSCGFGLRMGFPQLQRSVMRIDVGVPLTRSALPSGAGPMDVVVTFSQALPELDPSLRK